jgi:hypothetical protein
MSRLIGRIINNPNIIPVSSGRSGIWSLDYLKTIEQTTRWSGAPQIQSSTHSTVDAGSYSFATQAIGDADPNKIVYVLGANGSGTTAATAVTVAGSAATLVASFGGGLFALQLWAVNIQSATTTATVAVTLGSTTTYYAIHVYSAFPKKMEALSSTGTNVTGATTTLTMSLDIPVGGFAFSAIHLVGAAISTVSLAVGTTVARATTFSAAEPGTFISGVTNATTAYRPTHSVTSTLATSGANIFHFSAVFK